LRKGFEPLYDAKADWEIICELASYLGADFDYAQAKNVTSEIAEVVPYYSECRFDKIDDEGRRLYLSTGKEKVGFKRVNFEKLPEDKEYPFILITGNTYHHFGSLTQKGENLNSFVPQGFCEINPEDAQGLNISDDDKVMLESSSGKIEIRAKLNHDIQKGTVFVPINFEEIKSNLLMDKGKTFDGIRIRKI